PSRVRFAVSDVRFEGFDVVARGEPAASLCVRGDVAWLRTAGEWRALNGDAWRLVRDFQRDRGAGIVMLASYDAGRLVERVPDVAVDDTRLPWLLLHRFDRMEASASVVGRREPHEAAPAPAPALAQLTSPKEFEAMVV